MKKNLRKILLGGVVLVIITAALSYFLFFRHPKPIDLAQYAPENTLIFLEFENLPNIYKAFTQTRFCKQIGPAIGFPEQFLYLGNIIGWMKEINLGPDEVVTLGRAQWAVAVTGLEVEPSKEANLDVTPHWTLIAKAHTSASRVGNVLESRLPILARKIFGQDAVIEKIAFVGVSVTKYRTSDGLKKLFSVSFEDLIFLSNDESSLQSCLSTRLGSSTPLSTNLNLYKSRQFMKLDASSLFVFVNPSGINKLTQFNTGFLGKFSTGNENTNEQLIGNLTKGLAYSVKVENDHFVDRSLLLLHPEFCDSLRQIIKPTQSSRILEVLPKTFDQYSVFAIHNPAESFNKLQQLISANSNIAVSFGLRQIVNSLNDRYGITSLSQLSTILSDEIGLVQITPEANPVFFIEVNNRVGILPILDKYLRSENSKITNENYKGIELAISSSKDRAACFLEKFLVLGSKDQLKFMCDSYVDGNVLSKFQSTKNWKNRNYKNSAGISYSVKSDRKALEQLISSIARVFHMESNISEGILADNIQNLLNEFPLVRSDVELQPEGIYTETHSAIGNFLMWGMDNSN